MILAHMTEAWRVPFARFLKEHGAVEPGQARHYLYWIGRYRSSVPSDAEASPSARRFFNELARTEEPEHVLTAEAAIRLYSFVQGRGRTEPAPVTDRTTAPQWHAAAREMTRRARLKHLSLRTEGSYVGWLERFRAFAEEPSPAALAPRHVELFLSGDS